MFARNLLCIRTQGLTPETVGTPALFSLVAPVDAETPVTRFRLRDRVHLVVAGHGEDVANMLGCGILLHRAKPC